MKRDMDLVREILLAFERTDASRVGISGLAIDGYGKDRIALHLELMNEAGYLDHSVWEPDIGGRALIKFDNGFRPTMAGYDFLDSVRDPAIWAKTKSGALAAGGFTLRLLGELAAGFVKKQIEDRTNVKL